MNAPVVSLHDSTQLEALARRHRISPELLFRFATLVLKRGFAPEVALEELPVLLPTALLGELCFEFLELETRRDSAQDGATKLLFRTKAGAPLEAILLRIASGRTTLCLSCQSGCPVRCSFCATGADGLSAELTPEELLDQFVQARRLAAGEERQIRNLVFMGMGEPLLTERTLHASLRSIVDPRAFAFPAGRIAVSTVGLPEPMLRLARAFPEVRIALSLHSARQERREELIPLARRHTLEELRETVRELGRIQEGPVMIEYLLLEGLTDSPADLEALVRWLDGLAAHVNLIPYNPFGGAEPLRSTAEPARRAFAEDLRARGFACTLRHSLGADVLAGCGQLAGRRP